MKHNIHRHLKTEYLLGLESEVVIDREFIDMFPVNRPLGVDNLIVPIDDYYKVISKYENSSDIHTGG